MSSIKMKKQGARSALDSYGGHGQELSNAIEVISNVKSCRCMSGRNFSTVYKALGQVLTRLEDEKKDINKLENCLSDIVRTYETYENNISGGIKEKKAHQATAQSRTGTINHVATPHTYSFILPHGFLPDEKLFDVGTFVNSMLKNIGFGKIEKAAQKKLKDIISPYSETVGIKGIFDFGSDTWTKVDPDDQIAVQYFNDQMPSKKLKTQVTLAHLGDSAAVSVLGGVAVADLGWGSSTVMAELGKAQVYDDINIGLSNIQGILGTSITAFTASEELELGNDSVKVYVGSTQTVGRLAAKTEGRIGLLNDAGEFDPAMYLGTGAEAIVGEITGTAGVKVLGTDIGVAGSLNYGIGAHANVGFRDGKLSVDIGATLGVGGSVNLDIDVSGAVNTVMDAATAAWSQVTNLFGW